jgi:hypothetical protein
VLYLLDIEGVDPDHVGGAAEEGGISLGIWLKGVVRGVKVGTSDSGRKIA